MSTAVTFSKFIMLVFLFFLSKVKYSARGLAVFLTFRYLQFQAIIKSNITILGYLHCVCRCKGPIMVDVEVLVTLSF